MFLHFTSKELKNYFILPNFQDSSNHALLSVHIIIEEEFI